LSTPRQPPSISLFMIDINSINQQKTEDNVLPSKYAHLVGQYDEKVVKQKTLEKQVED
jgi:hypothetical protein